MEQVRNGNSGLLVHFSRFFNERSNAMKKMNVLLMVVLVGFGVSVANATWYDDFTAGPAWASPPTGWGGGAGGMRIRSSGGYSGDSNAYCVDGLGAPNWFNSTYKAMDAGDNGIYGKIMVVSADNDPRDGDLIASEGNQGNWGSTNFFYMSVQANGNFHSELRINDTVLETSTEAIPNFQMDTWYDVRAIFDYDNDLLIVQYKEVGSSTWLDSMNAPDYTLHGFHPTYMGMGGIRAGYYIDDVGTLAPIPEPATIGLMLLGLVGLIRRK